MVQTALHFACRDGNLQTVTDIVDGTNGHTSVELDAVDNCGRTSLHIAAKWGRLDVAKLLVERGANVNIKDQRGMTALDVCSEEKMRVLLERPSVKEADFIADEKARRRAQARACSAKWQAGEITDVEAEHELQRLELDYVWDDTRRNRRVVEYVEEEEREVARMESMREFMERRPLEMQADAYEKGRHDNKKKVAREKRERAEADRLEEIRVREEKREEERRRAEKREHKELRRDRICHKCGQIFTNENNRDGQCAHLGKWSPWGTDKKGNKVEWEFYWTCCKSTTYEGPCNGFSICAISDPHEESKADIEKHHAKMLKKLSLEHTKKSGAKKGHRKAHGPH